MYVLMQLLIAETLALTNDREVSEHEAALALRAVEAMKPLQREVLFASWPLQQALDAYVRALKTTEALRAARRLPEERRVTLGSAPGVRVEFGTTLGIVVCRCREDLGWLLDHEAFVLPSRTRLHLYVYQKCRPKEAPHRFGSPVDLSPDTHNTHSPASPAAPPAPSTADPADGEETPSDPGAAFGLPRDLVARLWAAGVARIEAEFIDDPGVRRDECVGYLRHIDKFQEGPPLASLPRPPRPTVVFGVAEGAHSLDDFTLFVHGAPGDHWYSQLAKLAVQSIDRGGYDVPFLHLNEARVVSAVTPCQTATYSLLFGSPPANALASYCCTQFIVRRDRLMLHDRALYRRMVELMDEKSPQGCHDIPGHATLCLMYELMWHVLFGEPDHLPLRSEDPRLPAVFRLDRPAASMNAVPPAFDALGTLVEVPML